MTQSLARKLIPSPEAETALTLKTRILLGGSWVVINGVISRVTILISHIRGIIAPLITTHEPPSKPLHTIRVL